MSSTVICTNFATMIPQILCCHFRNVCRQFHTSIIRSTIFHQQDRHAGYADNPGKPEMSWNSVKNGAKIFMEECVKMKEEFLERRRCDRVTVRPGEVEKYFSFEDADYLKQWMINCDSDHGLGYSKASFVRNASGNGYFSGVLCTDVPKDGKTHRSGYANIAAPLPKKSFLRDDFHDFREYTHIVFKVRGDGRPLLINLGCRGTFDITWFDTFSYTLFIRGGPYWQISRIPFSKFVFNAKGHIQDKQAAVMKGRITSFGLTVADSIDGPFELEIEYVGLEYDPGHQEELAYETYRCDKWLADC